MIEIDSDFNIINTNDALSDYIGKKKSSIIGKKINSVLSLDKKNMEDLTAGVQRTFENHNKQRMEIENNGKVYEAFISPLNDAKDRVKKVLLMLNDVTNARAIERQMLQDNKMIAVGQLAAGVGMTPQTRAGF
jgi:polar amino acid transport system substrate-binding protein